jgi:hypothetical protein
MQTGKVGRREK